MESAVSDPPVDKKRRRLLPWIIVGLLWTGAWAIQFGPKLVERWDRHQELVSSLHFVEGEVRVLDFYVPDSRISELLFVFVFVLVLGYGFIFVFGFCLCFIVTEWLSAVRSRTARS